jgi:peroxin-7
MPVGEPALLRVASASTRTRTRTTTATMNPNPSTPAVLHTPAFAQSNVAWSPFHTTRVAVATSANYGIVGNGRLYIASTLSGPSGMSSVKLDKL